MSSCVDHGQVGNGGGYGTTSVNGKAGRLHRVTYCRANSVDIETIRNKVVRHTCDNPRCINPEHLILGSQQDNVKDRVERQRSARQKGEAHGRCKLTDADIRMIRLLYRRGSSTHGQPALAKQFGVSQRQIYRIVHFIQRAEVNQ